MWNFKRTQMGVFLLVTCLGFSLISCATTNPDVPSFQVGPSYKPTTIEMATPIEIKMSPPKGRIDMTHVFSRSLTRTRSNNQLLHEREETVDFSVKTEVKDIEPKTGDRLISVETVRKEGPVDLYDLGYPDVGESLDYIYTTSAKVKKAGHFPANSLFFLPPISLPKGKVSIGETWSMEAQWIALRNGLPMSVEVMTIFKHLYKCGTKDQCAEMEISGVVKVPQGLTKTAKLQSQLEGRILYNISSGSIVWSLIRNIEKLQSGDDQMEIFSCTETLLEEPISERWPWRTQVGCDPQQALAGYVPGDMK